jgi:hypothetical protein
LKQVAGVLALVLLVFVGTLAFAIWIQQPAPTSTPSPGLSPTPTASLTPLPTPSAQLTPTPVEQSTPTPSPVEAPTPTPTATASPTPTPTPPPTPVAPARQIRFLNLGVDPPALEQSRARVITFEVDGPGSITVALSNVSAGKVRVCTWRGDARNQRNRECRKMKNGVVERAVDREGQSTWSVSLLGASANAAASLTLDLSFNTNAPHVRLAGFRFQGTEARDYNGFTVEFSAAAEGEFALDASLDDRRGGEYPYRLTYRALDSDTVSEETGGPSQRITFSYPVGAGSSWRVALENTQEFASRAVFLSATLDFP